MIYDILKHDHDELKGILSRLEALDENADPTELVAAVRDALIPHARAEEAVFYNSLREYERAKAKIGHSFREHMAAEALLRTLQVKEKLPLDWKKTVRELRSALDHHIREEEGEIFPLARQFFTDEEAQMLGRAFEELKEKSAEKGFMGNSLELAANLMPPRFSDKFKSYRPE
jgi:iron-sulfur cluster repair protein YtfE (RIC family)